MKLIEKIIDKKAIVGLILFLFFFWKGIFECVSVSFGLLFRLNVFVSMRRRQVEVYGSGFYFSSHTFTHFRLLSFCAKKCLLVETRPHALVLYENSLPKRRGH